VSATIARSTARGQTLFDVALVVGIMLVALAALSVQRFSSAPGAAASARAVVPAALQEARTIAESSGSGATLIVRQEPAGGAGRESFDLTLYRYRPEPESRFDAKQPERTWRLPGAVHTSLGPGTTAIFISSAGTASFALWAPGDPPLQNEPACVAPLEITVAGDPGTLAAAPATPPPGPPNGLAWFTVGCDGG
jgi:hypothetical protein